MKLKICGMKYAENINAVAALQPDYLGFIFYQKSKRNFDANIPLLSNDIKKVGVFVDAGFDFIKEKVQRYHLKAIQLHGSESPNFCKQCAKLNVEIIKVFLVDNDFDFKILASYEAVTDYFLFDTKGAAKGGNGVRFDWTLLNAYPSIKPYFLSGGIGLESVADLEKFKLSAASKYCCTLDVNSRFETAPGLKNADKLKEFKDNIL